MTYVVSPIGGAAAGKEPYGFEAMPSKSAAHRLLILAALSGAKHRIRVICRATNRDIDATADCLRALGAEIIACDGGFTVLPLDIFARGDYNKEEILLNVGESGSTLRVFLPILGALGQPAKIRREGRLPDRPLAPFDAVLTEHGMKLWDDESDRTYLHVSGQLTAGNYEIDGSVSSQFITGLLLALPLLREPSELHITGVISSAPYLAMTRTALARFGAGVTADDNVLPPDHYSITPKPFDTPEIVRVEGDWSGAAVLLCAGALTKNGITVTGLDPDSPQGDKRLCELLTAMGAKVVMQPDAVTVLPPDDGILKPLRTDADDIPDLVPVTAVLCAAANGESVLTGCERLRIKESDRLAATVKLLCDLGYQAEADGGVMHIHGGKAADNSLVSPDTCRDHRMVMAAALGALVRGGDVRISHAEAVAKSYPGFFEDFAKLCGVSLSADET
ncbi:MAG: 3-phosphoshikimate 1-carboxyvinyltransferase [Clostridia bacterium]|nr:3-phosphoshikimate 1-carboxyvinyltransferase [Clostridia bacterium]